MLQLCEVADQLGIPVLCYGLRTDFQAKLFPGSAALLALADTLVELKAVCECGRKATMNLRVDEEGHAVAARRADRDRRQRPLRRLVPQAFLRAAEGGRGPAAFAGSAAHGVIHGWIILDKPVGLGSHQAVSAVKRALREAGEPKTRSATAEHSIRWQAASSNRDRRSDQAVRTDARRVQSTMLHGWIILDKPVGLGSTQAVSRGQAHAARGGRAEDQGRPRRHARSARSGVLPIALGEATKLAGRMLDATKAYEFTIRFGEETDTLDAEGQVVATSDVRPTRDQIEAVIRRFTGEIEQVPPAYSALKIDGKAAYARARAGEEVELKPAQGDDLRACSCIDTTADSATFHATVSKGTYIRSLARDIARALNTVGHVTMLRRTRAGPFGLEQAISLDFLPKPLRRGG